jgi:hypothetical protein
MTNSKETYYVVNPPELVALWSCDSPAAMLAHLEAHVAAGHTVPDAALDRLRREYAS